MSITDHTGRSVDYSYDATYKLLTETVTPFPAGGTFAVSYTYDAVGNRLTKTVGGIATTTYSYDANDRLLSEVDGGAGTTTTYSYDANGNTTAKTDTSFTTTYVYDLENQLSDATTPSGTVSYRYDVDGMRVGQATAAADTTFLLDTNRAYPQVLAEYADATGFNATGAAAVTYVYGDDLISQNHSISGASYFHYDGLGSTRALTDSTGIVTDEYLYEAFGELLEQTGSTPNNYLYTGEQFDANVGFYYLRARYYDQAVGRFATLDTFAGRQFEPVTLHKYLYANVNPASFTDPSGQFSLGGVVSTARNIIVSAVRVTANFGRAVFARVIVTLLRSRIASVLKGAKRIGLDKKAPKHLQYLMKGGKAKAKEVFRFLQGFRKAKISRGGRGGVATVTIIKGWSISVRSFSRRGGATVQINRPKAFGKPIRIRFDP